MGRPFTALPVTGVPLGKMLKPDAEVRSAMNVTFLGHAFCALVTQATTSTGHSNVSAASAVAEAAKIMKKLKIQRRMISLWMMAAYPMRFVDA
ncbi:hypothetical protein BJF91_04615 [Allorhizobium taibaishanense]|uniref:Uncharacterized protein n=1 Tax=Allorhizobium taibaishanense TaxID=887144 RepID=A0A1Q8ZZB0_9HYPH|nr:hypothetical protein BJF91_04615 [Allorhizobium taibaishanense]